MGNSKRSRVVLVTLAVAIVAAGFVGYLVTRATEVDLVEVERRDVSEVYVVTGRVRSRTTSGVGSELAGRVAEVHVREGAKPKRATPLVDLQPIDAKLAVRQAEANVEISRRELERVRRGPTDAQLEQARANLAGAESDLAQARRDLVRAQAMNRDGVATRVELERAQNNVERTAARVGVAQAQLAELEESPRTSDIRVAQARLAAAEANLEQTRATLGKTTITAPFDGLVLRVDASVGENVRPGEPLVTLARIDDLELYAEVDESYFGRVEKGQVATVVFSSMPDQRFEAVVTQVGPDVDPNRGVIAVHLEPVELPADVVPGLSADVAIELARLADARSIPIKSLARERGQTYVMVLDEGTARRVEVEIEAEGEEFLAVSGLDEVDHVIANIALIEEGARVRARTP